ncbi:MAG: hypothetical protein R3D00_14340 [Bacteroidia bacterium]
MRISKTTQDKLQALLKDQGYIVRYERGNFQGGYCIVMDQKTIIVNKFHPLESKIGTLQEIIRQIDVDESLFSDDQKKLFKQVLAGIEE